MHQQVSKTGFAGIGITNYVHDEVGKSIWIRVQSGLSPHNPVWVIGARLPWQRQLRLLSETRLTLHPKQRPYKRYCRVRYLAHDCRSEFRHEPAQGSEEKGTGSLNPGLGRLN